MLASSMMIVTISEEQFSSIGYPHRTPSHIANGGWGNSLSRKSYKTNLSMLSTDGSMDTTSAEFSVDTSSETSNGGTGDDWGFFIESA